MPESKFYITDNERMELFEFVTQNNGTFTPALIVDEPIINTINTKEELIECIYDKTVRFYILSSCFQREIIPLSKNVFLILPNTL